MFRKRPRPKFKSFVVSARVRSPMAADLKREARRRDLPVSDIVRERLEAYAAHRQTLKAPAADQQPTTA